MSLLKKFFGEGQIRSKFGGYEGRVEHYSDNLAYVYDKKGECTGRIVSYGNDVTVYNNNGDVTEVGTMYGYSERLETYSFEDNSSRRYEDNGNYSVSSSSSSYSFGSVYLSDDDDDDSDSDNDSFW